MFLECEPDMTVVGYACNGREAVEFFRQHQPNVPLMDLRMPKMEGADAIALVALRLVLFPILLIGFPKITIAFPT